jgi:F-type H+-transporting ATPase subunit epsilon
LVATLRFELVSPERVLFSGDVEAVMLPGAEGDLTVLPGHAPLITTLRAGLVVLTAHVDEGSRVVLVRGGFAEINGTGVTILAERATPMQEITPALIDREILEISTVRDGTADGAAQDAANATIAQLESAKAALAL